MPDIKILHGNCLDILPTLPDCSVDSIVTDPPYELGFMGKKWDNSGIAYNPDLWRECLRVLKPGGHLLAFGGTRTYHRMAVAIEDAGFEIRDSLHWIYGSGFPKSLDVSKAIDKQAGAEREVVGSVRTNVGMQGGNFSAGSKTANIDITAPATEQAKEWQGWGTALKPAHEPIVVARKPLESTVAGNVLQYGTGALNIDGTRVNNISEKEKNWTPQRQSATPNINFGVSGLIGKEIQMFNPAGRWPANIVFTHNHNCQQIGTRQDTMRAGERTANFGTQETKSGGNGSGDWGSRETTVAVWECTEGCPVGELDRLQEDASRFFTVTEWDAPFRYVAKPGKRERNAGLDHLPAKKNAGSYEFRADGSLDGKKTEPKTNHHPTVKPLALMRWLVRLVTPPNGTVLEPFAGSGTTLVACHLEGFNAIGIEMTDEYLPIIEGRLEWARQQPPDQQSDQQELEL